MKVVLATIDLTTHNQNVVLQNVTSIFEELTCMLFGMLAHS